MQTNSTKRALYERHRPPSAEDAAAGCRIPGRRRALRGCLAFSPPSPAGSSKHAGSSPAHPPDLRDTGEWTGRALPAAEKLMQTRGCIVNNIRDYCKKSDRPNQTKRQIVKYRVCFEIFELLLLVAIQTKGQYVKFLGLYAKIWIATIDCDPNKGASRKYSPPPALSPSAEPRRHRRPPLAAHLLGVEVGDRSGPKSLPTVS